MAECGAQDSLDGLGVRTGPKRESEHLDVLAGGLGEGQPGVGGLAGEEGDGRCLLTESEGAVGAFAEVAGEGGDEVVGHEGELYIGERGGSKVDPCALELEPEPVAGRCIGGDSDLVLFLAPNCDRLAGNDGVAVACEGHFRGRGAGEDVAEGALDRHGIGLAAGDADLGWPELGAVIVEGNGLRPADREAALGAVEGDDLALAALEFTADHDSVAGGGLVARELAATVDEGVRRGAAVVDAVPVDLAAEDLDLAIAGAARVAMRG